MQPMLRHCNDDFEALLTATGMMKAGAKVICITDAGGAPYAKSPGRFIVWAEVRDNAHCDEVDEAIGAERNK